MNKEPIKKENASIALFGDDVGGGFDNVTTQDTSLPYVRILGQLSAEVNEGDGKYIPGAKAGMIYNNITNEIFDGKKGIKVIPCYYKRDYVEKSDKGDLQAIIVAVHSSTSSYFKQGKREGSKYRMPNGNYLEETAYWYVLMETNTGGMTPALITMKSSQLSISKKWMSMCNLVTIPDGKGGFKKPPHEGLVFNLSSIVQKNDKGTWYGWSVELDRVLGSEPKDDSLYLSSKTFKNDVKKGNVQTKEDVEEKPKDSTPY